MFDTNIVLRSIPLRVLQRCSLYKSGLSKLVTRLFSIKRTCLWFCSCIAYSCCWADLGNHFFCLKRAQTLSYAHESAIILIGFWYLYGDHTKLSGVQRGTRIRFTSSRCWKQGYATPRKGRRANIRFISPSTQPFSILVNALHPCSPGFACPTSFKCCHRSALCNTRLYFLYGYQILFPLVCKTGRWLTNQKQIKIEPYQTCCGLKMEMKPSKLKPLAIGVVEVLGMFKQPGGEISSMLMLLM